MLTPDPTSQPGTVDGDVALVYVNDISGYTWAIVRGSDGSTSGACAGQPTESGTCLGNPGISFTVWTWNEPGLAWVETGSGTTNGCGGGGGNN